MINKIKQTLGITNREFYKNGIDRTTVFRWNQRGFTESTEKVLNLLITEMNAMKKADFLKKYIVKYHGKLDQKKITNEILGMRKWHEFTGLIIPEWLELELVDEIIKKLGK